MTQLRSPIIWRLILWFILLSLVPIGIVLVFVQRQVRATIIDIQLQELRDQAGLVAASLSSQLANDQEISLTAPSPEDVVFIANPDGTYFSHTNHQKIGRHISEDFSSSIINTAGGYSAIAVEDTEHGLLIASAPVPASDLTVFIAIRSDINLLPLNELSRSVTFQLAFGLLLSSLAGGAAILTLLNPLTRLAQYSDQLGSGNLGAEIETEDMEGELSTLANSLKTLSKNMHNAISSLENRVAERTKEFERRAAQLQAAADVGKVITSIRDLNQMLEQTTQLISRQFGFYHTGIFLLDEHGEYAVLTASNSEGGKRMLARKHRLKVGETGIVGFVSQSGKARIALDVGQDAVYFDNPDLPQTRSEMALPLIASGQILGALDVQSTEPQAFTESDAVTLQVMADQLAIAIQNTRLFEQNQAALEAARRAYGETSRDAWKKLLRTEEQIGYVATAGSVQSVSSRWSEDLVQTVQKGDIKFDEQERTVSIPVRIRGQAVGAIRLRKHENMGAWTNEETSLALAFTEQLGSALESARLYREAQQRATREGIVSDIASRITTSPHLENVIRDTVMELGQAIGNATVTFQLIDTRRSAAQAEGRDRRGNSDGADEPEIEDQVKE